MSDFYTSLFGLYDGGAHVGSLRVADLAASFGTPTFVIDMNRVQRRVEQIRSAVKYRPLQILYSVKAYANVAFLTRLRALGVGLDVCSEGDLRFAAAAGYADEELSFVGFGLLDREIEQIARRGVCFTADSIEQVARYGHAAPGGHVSLRLNCSVETGCHPGLVAGAEDSKFGVALQDVGRALKCARAHDLTVVGLHGHLGSDLVHAEPHIQLLQALIEVALHVSTVSSVNLGGGWGVAFAPDERDYDFPAFDEAAQKLTTEIDRPLELRVEPGTFLVRDAGYLISTAVECKSGPRERLVLDTGINHLIGRVLFGARYPVRDATIGRETRRLDLAGNLMQGGDVLAVDQPLAATVGDVVVFGLVGAYGAVCASTFNERPRPAEVLVADGRALLTRRRETVDDLLHTQVRDCTSGQARRCP